MPSLISNLYAFGEFRVDPQNRLLLCGDEAVTLTPKGFEVLLVLVRSGGRVVSKQELMQAVWPDSFVEESNLTQTVFMLRKALGETTKQKYILTVQGQGYRFAPEVRTVQPLDGDLTQAPVAVTRVDQPVEDAKEALVANNEGSRRRVWIPALLILMTLGVAAWLYRPFQRAKAAPPLRSIAVLPLDNFSGDPSQEFFVDGMTDELITDLAKVGSLRVISRTSVMQYKGTKKELPQIARELNVDGIIEGSVTRSGGRIRITAQLINAVSDQHLWAESYEREEGDALRLQSEVAQAIAKQVQAQLTPQEQVRLGAAQSVNPEAYEAYLKGRYFLSTAFSSADSLKLSKQYFEEAIRKDPKFARGYSGLADSYVWMGLFHQISPAEAHRLAMEAIRQSRELDSNIGEIHDTLGMLKWRFEWNWAAAEQEFNQAITMAPSYSCAHEDRASYLSFIGKREEALAGVKNSRDIDPGPSSASTEIAVYYELRDFEKLIETSKRGLVVSPNEWTSYANLAVGYEGMGRMQEAIPNYRKAVELSKGDQDATASLAHAYALTGKKAQAENILRELQKRSKTSYVSPYLLATVFAAVGDKDSAFEYLEKAYQERSLDLSWHIRADLRLDGLRSDARFQSLMRRIGLS
jgi:TolB-like protein/DNA-binding winged helix-turn-helix (wHTH) protein/Flp pilus assembly protein TadD